MLPTDRLFLLCRSGTFLDCHYCPIATEKPTQDFSNGIGIHEYYMLLALLRMMTKKVSWT